MAYAEMRPALARKMFLLDIRFKDGPSPTGEGSENVLPSPFVVNGITINSKDGKEDPLRVRLLKPS